MCFVIFVSFVRFENKTGYLRCAQAHKKNETKRSRTRTQKTSFYAFSLMDIFLVRNFTNFMSYNGCVCAAWAQYVWYNFLMRILFYCHFHVNASDVYFQIFLLLLDSRSVCVCFNWVIFLSSLLLFWPLLMLIYFLCFYF